MASRNRSLGRGIVGVAVVGAIVLGAAAVTGVGGAPASEGCATVADGTIQESTKYTPYADRLSHLPDRLILGEASADRTVPRGAQFRAESVGGLLRQHTIATEDGSVYAYFLDQSLGGVTGDGFFALGGIQLLQDPASPGQSFVDHVLNEFPDRGTPIEVGDHHGVLTWADPLENGVRTHNLYWSDGRSEFALIADMKAEAIVSLARTLECG